MSRRAVASLLVVAMAGLPVAQAEERTASPGSSPPPAPSARAGLPPVGPVPSPARTWQIWASSALAVRGNQGGIAGAGLRLVGAAGLSIRALELVVSVDRKIGARGQVFDRSGDAATWSEWAASVWAGRKVALERDLWVRILGGASLVHAEVDSAATTLAASRSNLGVELVAAIAWRSGPITTSAIIGATAIPIAQTLRLDTTEFELPARIEPWMGLGIGLIF